MRRLGLFALLAIAVVGGFAAWLDHQVSRPYKNYSGASVVVDIPRGTSRWGVATLLQRNGVIPSRLAFELASHWHWGRSLQAGEYLFDKPMNEREVFWKIAGGRIYLHTVKILEGWTMFDIADALEKEGLATRDDFLKVARDPSPVRDIAPTAPSLEGYLFPDTYQLPRHMEAKQIAALMTRHFRSEWAALNPNGANPAVSVENTVTLASLVESETPQESERPLVAGVFSNRLRRNGLLQCDPTVQYALALAGHPEHTIRPADLHVDSPYNTYEHRGLPPGPIANPGEASLRAALSPAKTEYLYFVANDAGGHFFSATLEEHNRNVARYRHLLARNAAGEGPALDPPSAPVADPAPAAAPPKHKPSPRRSHKKRHRRHS